MKEKILVLVRATPQESKKYAHTVCVAGINEKGEWRRLYPFKFSYGKGRVDFKKRDLIEVDLEDSPNDKRPESRKVKSHTNLGIPQAYPQALARITPLISNIGQLKAANASLGVVKPELLGVEIKVHDTNIYDGQQYFSLAKSFLETREKVKMPVELRYEFRCRGGNCNCSENPHKLALIDWELNELARNIMRREKDPKIIEAKLREKFLYWMGTRDLHFFLGTHYKYKTWIIIGIFYPPKPEGP